jgi:glycosyltransferase involved in cell wall biosynthesis
MRGALNLYNGTMKYVLITPARNEGAFIEKTLRSMVNQTVLPDKWVIVDDGSKDSTAQLVEKYLADNPWIELVRREQRPDRSFSRKVDAFNAGLQRVSSREFDVIGNLDADLSFDPEYLAFLINKFAEDPKLGVAGTPFVENGYDSAKDSFEGENHVAGGCQLFRRRCFEEIGGYIGNPAGGIDWIAVTTARMKGWKTRSFPEKRFNHYRALGTAERGEVAALFSYGEKDYYLGNSPIWEVFRVTYRMVHRPFFVAGLSLLAGYSWAALRRVRRPVSRELIRFHRREEMQKLRAIFGAVLRFRKVDAFRLTRAENRSSLRSDV